MALNVLSLRTRLNIGEGAGDGISVWKEVTIVNKARWM